MGKKDPEEVLPFLKGGTVKEIRNNGSKNEKGD